MAKGKITLKDSIEEKVFDIGVDYAKSLNPAIEKNKEWSKSFEIIKQQALGLAKLSGQFQEVKSRKEFLELLKKEADLRKKTAQALEQEEKVRQAAINTKNKQLLLERKLEASKKKNSKLTEEERLILVKSRLELQRLNKEAKESGILTSKNSSEIQKATIKRNIAVRSIQSLIAKKELGNKLTIKEQLELRKASAEYRKYDKAIKIAKQSTGQFQENVGNYPKTLGIAFKSILPLIGAGLSLREALNFTNEARQLAIEAKGVDFAFAQIESRTGDAEKALLRVKKSTRGLLSDLDIKKAIIELDNFNIGTEETDTLLGFLAVRANQTGESIDKLKSSLVEGLSKESKLRIDNLGISTKELNDELKRTPDFVQAVANIAKKEIKEAGSILDDAGNSQEKWNADLQNFKLAIGQSSFVSKFSDGLFSVGSNLLRMITPAKDVNKQFEEQAKFVIDLGENLNPLISEYDTLKDKTELSKEEQIRLKTVITDISKIVPTAISQFDDYGNALDINSDKAKEFISNQKALLSFRNKEALEEEKEALEDYQKEIKSLNIILNRRDANGNIVRNVIKGGKIARVEQKKLSDSYIAEKQAELARLQQLEIGAKQSIDQLSGEYLTKYVEREKEKTQKILEELQKRAKALGINFDGKTANELKYLIKKYENRKLSNDEIKKLEEQRIKDKYNLDKYRLEQEIKNQDEILSNDKLSYDERFLALRTSADRQRILLEEKLKFELKNIKKGSDAEKLIKEKHTSELNKLQKKNQEKAGVLYLTKVKELQKIEEKEEKIKNNKIRQLQLDFQNGKIKSIEEYEKQVAGVKFESAKNNLISQIDFLETELLLTAKTAQQKIVIEEELAKVKAELLGLDFEEFKRKNKEKVDSERTKTQKLEDIRLKFIEGTSDAIGQAFGINSSVLGDFFDVVTKKFDETTTKAEKFSEITKASFAVVGEIGNAIYGRNIENIEAEIAANDEKYANLIELAQGDSEQQELLRKEQELKREELEKKKRKEQVKQAKFNKAAAALNVVVSTGQAIIGALAQVPKFDFGISAGLLAGAYASIGALQLAAVLSAPIPKYAKGTENHPGGFALVGEERPEVIQEPNKKPYVISKPSILDLPSSTVVTPSIEEYHRMLFRSNFSASNDNFKDIKQHQINQIKFPNNNQDIVNELQLTREAINKSKQSIHLHEREIDIEHAIWSSKNKDWDN